MRARQIDIRTFVSAILDPTTYFSTLKDVVAILDDNQTPIFYSGIGSAIFKVNYKGRVSALKCYDQSDSSFVDGISEVNSYFNNLDIDYINKSTIYPKELKVIDNFDREVAVTVELYDWIEGITLSDYIRKAIYIRDVQSINAIIDPLIKISIYLISQKFAHGDIKSENIIIDHSLSIKLIDFNNAYIPNLSHSPLGELGTYGYRHPKLNKNYYNTRLDDYPLLLIITTLLIIIENIDFYTVNYDGDFLLINSDDIISKKSTIYLEIKEMFSKNILFSKFIVLLESRTPAIDKLGWYLEKIFQYREAKEITATSTKYDINGGKYALCDDYGNLAIPAIFDDVAHNNGSLFAVCIDNQWGVVDGKGIVVQDFEYEMIGLSKEGLVMAKKYGKFGFLDENFNIVIDFSSQDANNFSEGYAVVKIDGKYGYIDRQGLMVVEAKYDFALNVRGSKASVRIEENKIEIFFTNR